LAFNFVFLHSPFTAVGLQSIVDATERALPEEAWPVWAISTHDLPRFVDRWCAGSLERARCALVMLLTLRGTPVLYYGDELGMGDVPVPPEQRGGIRAAPRCRGRPGRGAASRRPTLSPGCRSRPSRGSPWRSSGVIPTPC
jgi:alpha-glucosidase